MAMRPSALLLSCQASSFFHCLLQDEGISGMYLCRDVARCPCACCCLLLHPSKAFNALTLVQLKQYEVVGRKFPTEKNPRPELYKVGARCGTATPSSRFRR